VKIVFFGTSAVSVPFLAALLECEQIVGVVTRPDRPAERGQKIQMPAVKALARDNNIPVFQPERFTDQSVDELQALHADLGIAVSYGRIIPERVFAALRYGCFNVHFSLLPKYRGAAPVQWALINGEKETGVTTFWIEKTLDTGPVLVCKPLPIAPDDNALTLMQKLILSGVDVMKETVAKIRAGDCTGTAQTGEASLARCLTKEDGNIDWSGSAPNIVNRIRGTLQWPGAHVSISDGKFVGKRLKILKAGAVEVCPEGPAGAAAENGQVVGVKKNDGFVVRCGTGCLVIEEVQPDNKKPMPAWAFWQSGWLHVGSRLGSANSLSSIKPDSR